MTTPREPQLMSTPLPPAREPQLLSTDDHALLAGTVLGLMMVNFPGWTVRLSRDEGQPTDTLRLTSPQGALYDLAVMPVMPA